MSKRYKGMQKVDLEIENEKIDLSLKGSGETTWGSQPCDVESEKYMMNIDDKEFNQRANLSPLHFNVIGDLKYILNKIHDESSTFAHGDIEFGTTDYSITLNIEKEQSYAEEEKESIISDKNEDESEEMPILKAKNKSGQVMI